MTIPKSYEALAADLASEKILSKTLIGQKEAYMMLADQLKLDLATWKQKACEAAEREAALREELAKFKAGCVDLSSQVRELEHKMDYYKGEGMRADDLQQRLTVAEQRADELEGLLRESYEAGDHNIFGTDLDSRIDAALKPAAEVAAYCTHPPGCKQCSWCGFKAESKLAAEGEGS